MRQVLYESAIRDFIRTQRSKGKQLTWNEAQRNSEFLQAMDALERLKGKRVSVKSKREATKALKALGRISKYAKGIYF